MTIVIIEDEPLTARDLASCIRAAEPAAEILASLASVGEANDWFKRNEAPDVIFSDIQLGDGNSFAIFERLMRMVPVIFCTAYDEYALEAFGAAGIDYILKPFTGKTVKSALERYKSLKGAPRPKAAAAVLVYHKDKILPLKLEHIALFYLEKEIVRLETFDEKTYIVNKPLEELEGLTGEAFFRVNRQFLVNRTAIKDVSQYFGRKLLVNLHLPFEEKITVGRLKAPVFLAWLAGN